MRVAKVFNNNVVLGLDEHGAESVVLGRGIGFQARPGDPIDPLLVEKAFVPSASTTAERLAAFVDEIPLDDIVLTEEIVAVARAALGDHVTRHVLVPLADHISFALRRAAEGISIEYPLSWEIATLYPAEVAVGRTALEIIEQRRGVRLPDLEAVPIALHLVTTQFGTVDIGTTVRMTEVLSEVLSIIRDEHGTEIDEDSVEVARFVTHLRYLFARERAGRSTNRPGLQLSEAVRAARPREYGSALRIAALLDERFGWNVDEDEVLFLCLHVARLTDEPTRTAALTGPAAPTTDRPLLA